MRIIFLFFSLRNNLGQRLLRSSQPGGQWAPQEAFSNVWRPFFGDCHNGSATGRQGVKARDAATHPVVHRTVPTTKGRAAQNANSLREGLGCHFGIPGF